MLVAGASLELPKIVVTVKSEGKSLVLASSIDARDESVGDMGLCSSMGAIAACCVPVEEYFEVAEEPPSRYVVSAKVANVVLVDRV